MMRLFEPIIEEATEAGGNYIMRSFITYTRHQILLGHNIKVGDMAKSSSMHEEINSYLVLVEKSKSKR
jgi:hypothetical protein